MTTKYTSGLSQTYFNCLYIYKKNSLKKQSNQFGKEFPFCHDIVGIALVSEWPSYIKLRKIFGKFFRLYSEFLSKFSEMFFKDYVSKVISRPIFNGDIVYKLLRGTDSVNFVWSHSRLVGVERMTQCSSRGRQCTWPFYGLLQTFLKAFQRE